MKKKTFGRLLSAVISLTMIITSVVPAEAVGEVAADVNFYDQNEESLSAEETDIVSDESGSYVKRNDSGADLLENDEPDEAEDITGYSESEPVDNTENHLFDDDTETEDAETVSVTFYAEGGFFENGEESLALDVLSGTILAELKVSPEKEGFEFLGWYLDEELSEVIDEVSFLITENSVFYAKWQEITSDAEEIDEDIYDEIGLLSTTATITFDANGGENAYFHYYNTETSVYEDVQCVEFENKGNGRYDLGKLISNDLHWRLRGFSTDKNATWPEYYYDSDSTYKWLSNINSEENYTFYAVWEKNAYLVVTFDAGEDCYLEYKENGEIKRSQTWQVAVGTENWYENDGVFYWYFEIPHCEVFYKDETI